mmetsp:Transcript_21305/g.64874  ORF Transcript_21305/g.64874 Transcript_21305/m.64874 type:complete len:323 (+) Transcript_21305:1043-2011(+)
MPTRLLRPAMPERLASTRPLSSSAGRPLRPPKRLHRRGQLILLASGPRAAPALPLAMAMAPSRGRSAAWQKPTRPTRARNCSLWAPPLRPQPQRPPRTAAPRRPNHLLPSVEAAAAARRASPNPSRPRKCPSPRRPSQHRADSPSGLRQARRRRQSPRRHLRGARLRRASSSAARVRRRRTTRPQRQPRRRHRAVVSRLGRAYLRRASLHRRRRRAACSPSAAAELRRLRRPRRRRLRQQHRQLQRLRARPQPVAGSSPSARALPPPRPRPALRRARVSPLDRSRLKGTRPRRPYRRCRRALLSVPAPTLRAKTHLCRTRVR